MLSSLSDISIYSILLSALYIFTFVCAGLALWRSRTPQGAIAWIVALISLPFVSLPLFLLFGRNRFFGYVRERKQLDTESQEDLSQVDALLKLQKKEGVAYSSLNAIAKKISQLGFTGNNEVELLVDGEQTYASMLQSMREAQKYILIQFYIFRLDQIGREFIEVLAQKAEEGVRVYFLYDAVGTSISSKAIKALKKTKISIASFRSTKAWISGLQINFRNHRKNLVIDGQVAFVGGLNIGDEYLGKGNMGAWRDTHSKLKGPAALAAQTSFIKDWYWVKEEILDLNWMPYATEAAADALVLHTGPADEIDGCLLSHIALINKAQHRVWLSNPYFVPPEGLLNALISARLRGVEVKILLPSYGDNRWVTAASHIHQEKALRAGLEVHQYQPGFLHQKVLLIDEQIGGVGSVNLDQRSMFINFEIAAYSSDPKFVQDLEYMLRQDLKNSKPLSLDYFTNRPFYARFISRIAGLFDTIL